MPDLWDRSPSAVARASRRMAGRGLDHAAQARKLGLTPGELSILLQNRPAPVPALRVIIGGRKW